MNNTKKIEEIKRNIFDSFNKLSENPAALEVVPSYSHLAEYYLKIVAKTNPEYVQDVRKAFINFL
jgi:hypothetical protein